MPDRDDRPDDLYTLLWNELEEAHKRVLYLGMYLGRWYNARHDHYLRTIAYDAAGLEGIARSIKRLAEGQEQAPGVGRRATEEQEQEQETDSDAHRLLQTMDAKEWAHAFMRVIVDGNVPIDEGLMIGWFANAIMTGWDFNANASARGQQEEQEEQERG